ncbi:MAG TPA: hypothetical protein VF113_14440 [Stellaceae bacterium]
MTGRQRHTARTRALIAWAVLAAAASVAACAPPGGGSGSSTPGDDVVGGGGQIDQTYREIYQPGSGTNF